MYCDESVWVPVAEGLRRRGWTVTTAVEEETLGDPDVQQLQYAAQRNWFSTHEIRGILDGRAIERRRFRNELCTEFGQPS
jgi:hypothetical protein